MKLEKELLLDIKSQFGWPVDLARYGLSNKSEFWDGKKKFTNLSPDLYKRVQISKDKLENAKRLCKYLERIHWIEGIFVTGSVASYNAKPLDDIDIWLIVQNRRIWLVRAIDFFIYSFLRRRRLASDGVSDLKVNNKLCFNLYTTMSGAEFSLHNPSFAIQFMDAIPIYLKKRNYYYYLVKKNSWIQEFFPSWYKKTIENFKDEVFFKALSTTSKRCIFFDFWEYIAGVLMLLKSKKKLFFNKKDIYIDMFTTWETDRILTINVKKTITKRGKKE